MHCATLPKPGGFSVTSTWVRRPSIENAPTDAKAGCLYPNNARALRDARSRGFDNALVCDGLGNVAETATSNIFLAKDGVVKTPIPNGTFLNGITRQRTIALLRDLGATVIETVLRDRPYADVAAELGVAPGTLRTRVHYGLRRLRCALETADAAA